MNVRQLLCSRHCGLTVNAVMTLADGAGFAGELVTSEQMSRSSTARMCGWDSLMC
jgi:hypothetical protein